MKKYFLLATVLLVAMLFCACQANPSKDIVKSKNDGAFERSIVQKSTQNKAINDFLLTKNGLFFSTDESVTFTWNINQSINMGSMPVLEAIPHFFTGNDVEHITKALFDENANFYDLGPVTKRQLSKTQIQEKIHVLSQYVSEDKLLELMGEEANIENVKFWLEHYTVAYETAPEKPSYKKCDWTLKPLQYYEDSGHSLDSKSQGLFATTTVNGYSYLVRTYVHNDSDYTRNELFITLGDGDDPTYVQKTADIAKLCCTDEPTEAQITFVKNKTQNMLSSMGLCDYVLADVSVEKQFFGEKPAYQIRLEAVPAFDGIPTLYGDFGRSYTAEELYNSSYAVGRTQLFFSANGDLISCGITNPVEVKDVINQNVSTLPIEELTERAQMHMSLYDAQSLDRFTGNAMMLEALTGRSIDSMDCKVEINGVEYGLGRFPVADSNSFYYAPAIVFYGTIDYCDKNSGEVITGTGNPYGTRLQSLVVINAVDGTIY